MLLVAVAVSVAVAAAFWLATIATQCTLLELLDVSCSAVKSGSRAEVQLRLHNRGQAAARIVGVAVNGREIPVPEQAVEPGGLAVIRLEVNATPALEVEVRTSRGSYRCITRVDG